MVTAQGLEEDFCSKSYWNSKVKEVGTLSSCKFVWVGGFSVQKFGFRVQNVRFRLLR